MKYIQETKQVGKYIVSRHQVYTTTLVCYDVYEPAKVDTDSTHSFYQTFAGKHYGQISSRRLPADLEALPAMTEARLSAVNEWQKANYAEQTAVILEAYPHLQGIAHRAVYDGSIETNCEGQA